MESNRAVHMSETHVESDEGKVSIGRTFEDGMLHRILITDGKNEISLSPARATRLARLLIDLSDERAGRPNS